jgi:virginiamycin B lyase
MTVSVLRRWGSFGLALILVTGASIAGAQAQTFSLFSIPTASSQPTQIAAGADGNLWFTEFAANKIGKITPAGVVTEYSVPTANSGPYGIALGNDGNMWFTEANGNKIGTITPLGSITEISIPTAGSTPHGITLGPDGLIWFTESEGAQIGRVNANGSVSEFTAAGKPEGITTGSDNNIWYTEFTGGQVAKSKTDGTLIIECTAISQKPTVITPGPDGKMYFAGETANVIIKMPVTCGNTGSNLPSANTRLRGITVGADGKIWFTESTANKIGSLGMDGTLTEFDLPAPNLGPEGIAQGPDGNLWFIAKTGNQIGRYIPAPSLSATVASVLPASRSVQVGKSATVFASIIATTAMDGCGIAPVVPVSGTFSYQTTNPATNQLSGTPNTRVSIPAGGLQTYVIAYKANGSYPSADVQFGYDCIGSSTGFPAAVKIVGVNTVRLTFSPTPVADMIAVGTTPSNDGFATLAFDGVFAIATSNVGVAAQLTGKIRLSNPSLPLTATVCETDPVTAVCKQPPAASVSRVVAQNETATFAAFLHASDVIPSDPAANRILFEFTDPSGVVRGSTSVAVRTPQ